MNPSEEVGGSLALHGNTAATKKNVFAAVRKTENSDKCLI